MSNKNSRMLTHAELALIRLKFQGLELTKENLDVTLRFKPTGISRAQWWAMLNSIKGEKNELS